MRIPSKYRNVTGIAIFVVLISLSVWDVFLAFDDTPGNTISEVAHAHPGIVVVLAYLLGHFWPLEAVLRRIWTRS